MEKGPTFAVLEYWVVDLGIGSCRTEFAKIEGRERQEKGD